MARTPHSDFGCAPGCPVEAALQHIGGKWKGVILFHLLEEEVLRFSELRRKIPNVTQRVLTKQLRELEASELITRKVYPEVPPRVEYRLSGRGKLLSEIVHGLHEFGKFYYQPVTNGEAGESTEEKLAKGDLVRQAS